MRLLVAVAVVVVGLAVPAGASPDAPTYVEAVAVDAGWVWAGDQLLAPTLDRPVWLAVAWCESTHRWSIVDRSGRFHGGLQIASAGVEDLNADEQVDAARSILTRQGWRAWPTCARRLGFLR